MLEHPYYLLPFQFAPFGERYLLVSETGDFMFIERHDLLRFVNSEMETSEDVFNDLKARDFVCLKYTSPLIKSISTKYRTKKRHIFDSTSLNMIVLTYRCNQRCLYCHASADFETQKFLDMPIETAKKCVDFSFQSPSPYIKIEFQGGEPTLNFKTLKECVIYGKKLASVYDKKVEFVVCTNIYDISDEQIHFFHENNVQISTSLDGPRELHDACRVTVSGVGSYDHFTTNLERIRRICGTDSVSALLTVSKYNLKKLPAVIDEYIRLGFNSIFIRMLNPFGRAYKAWDDLCYSIDDFSDAYLEALEYIFEINKKGIFFIEEFAAILLGRIMTPFPCGFVDLQSPAGTAISGIIYDVDGDIFVSDEARMLKRADGDSHFCLGNVNSSSRHSIFNTDRIKEIAGSSVIESLPGCAWCVFQSFCGCDPVRNYHLWGDYVSHKPTDPYCRFHKSVFESLFQKILDDDPATLAIIWSWLTGANPQEFERKGRASV